MQAIWWRRNLPETIVLTNEFITVYNVQRGTRRRDEDQDRPSS
jgi:hypothetical protein